MKWQLSVGYFSHSMTGWRQQHEPVCCSASVWENELELRSVSLYGGKTFYFSKQHNDVCVYVCVCMRKREQCWLLVYFPIEISKRCSARPLISHADTHKNTPKHTLTEVGLGPDTRAKPPTAQYTYAHTHTDVYTQVVSARPAEPGENVVSWCLLRESEW